MDDRGRAADLQRRRVQRDERRVLVTRESSAASKSRSSLFPDNAYGFDSGGDPAVIPDLTYAEFKAFHETYYHPSNAYIYFYGDDPEPERLRLLDEWLTAFERKEVQSQIPLQPRFSQPQRLTCRMIRAIRRTAKGYVTVNWLLPEGADVERTLSLSILSHILIATPASPLRKASDRFRPGRRSRRRV